MRLKKLLHERHRVVQQPDGQIWAQQVAGVRVNEVA